MMLLADWRFDIYKQLIEINTTDSVGSVTTASEALAKRFRDAMRRDLAHTALFLASDASRFITAHDLVVDGGITAGRTHSEMIANSALFQKEFGSQRR